jgi:thermitase
VAIRLRAPLAVLLAALVSLTALPAAARAQGAPTPAELERQGITEIIVKRRPGLDRADRAQVRADARVQLDEPLRLRDTELVRAEPGRLTEALAALDADPDVVYAEPNAPVYPAATDPFFGTQWGLHNTGQDILGSIGTPDADIDAPEAWGLGADGTGQTVAVLDTGVDAGHPDLTGQLAINPGESGDARETNGLDDDHNGHADDWRGWDFADGDNDPADGDLHGHGSHVAGIVAARADTVGVVGVAPAARVMPIRVLGAGGGTSVSVGSGYDYAGDLGIRVVNASLGGGGISQFEADAIAGHPNTLYVVAAGNAGDDGLGDDNDVTPTYPCNLSLANVICVGATDNQDQPAGFSNYGATTVDLFAPGVNVLSSALGEYWWMSGTSMATPHVAGTVALMRDAAPSLDAAALRTPLLGSVDPLPQLRGRSVTGGRLNAAAAVAAAVAAATVPVAPPDSDGDGVPDASDNCPDVANAGQADTDQDGKGDACDPTPNGPVTPDPAPAPAPGKDPAPSGDPAPEPSLAPALPVVSTPSTGVTAPPVPQPFTPSTSAGPAPNGMPTAASRAAAPTVTALAGAATVRVCPAGRDGCRPRSVTFTFRLDRAALVTVEVQRRRCVSGTCRYVTTRTLAVSARAGANRLAIGGRGPTARLKPGAYRLRLTTGTAAKRSAGAVRAFRVAAR